MIFLPYFIPGIIYYFIFAQLRQNRIKTGKIRAVRQYIILNKIYMRR